MSKNLLAEILSLPKEERAELARHVLRSLAPENDARTPATCDADWHRPWTDELERRRREIAEGARLDCEKLRAKLAARG
jgi:hypothetical protein